jgi:transcriptional regulator with XRE-family HTH domain
MTTDKEPFLRIPTNKAIAYRIRELCNAQNITVNSLAAKARVPLSTLYRLLKGKSRNPGIERIERICRTLRIDLHTFFDSMLFR